jgi:outer membrane lipoprotein-sorting protein
MKMVRILKGWFLGGALLSWTLAGFGQAPAPQLNAVGAEGAAQASPLPAETVARELQERNAQRAAALLQYSATRVYRLQYRGFPSDRDAEMVVDVSYRAPNVKTFTVVSKTGSKFILDHIFNKLLEGEQEAANQENRRESALTSENYRFTSAGYEVTPAGGEYVLNLLPKTRNKFLYRGKIWVDAKDFAVVRIEGEPAKNPSFWIKNTEVRHRYIKVKGFWLPAENHTESVIRLGGRALLSIEYKDYKITETVPQRGVESARENSE